MTTFPHRHVKHQGAGHGVRSLRGEATMLLLLLLGAFGGGLIVGPKAKAVLTPPPPTKALAEANARADKAETALAVAQAAEKAAQTGLVRNAQQMVAGTRAALDRAPASPEVALASNLNHRAELSLALAIGELPQAQKAEILGIVDALLSRSEARIAAAEKALSEKDKEARQLGSELSATKAAIPGLAAAKAAAEKDRDVKEQKLVAYAKEAAEESSRFWQIVLWAVGAVIVVNFVIPCIAQEFPGLSLLQHFAATVKSLTSAHK